MECILGAVECLPTSLVSYAILGVKLVLWKAHLITLPLACKTIFCQELNRASNMFVLMQLSIAKNLCGASSFSPHTLSFLRNHNMLKRTCYVISTDSSIYSLLLISIAKLLSTSNFAFNPWPIIISDNTIGQCPNSKVSIADLYLEWNNEPPLIDD